MEYHPLTFNVQQKVEYAQHNSMRRIVVQQSLTVTDRASRAACVQGITDNSALGVRQDMFQNAAGRGNLFRLRRPGRVHSDPTGATPRGVSNGTQQLRNRLRPWLGQRNGPRAEIGEMLLVIDSERLQDRGVELGSTDFTVSDLLSVVVGLAENRPTLDATTGQRGTPG